MSSILSELAGTAAIGCMRLSTAPDRNEDRAVEVLHAAWDAGVRLVDTANAYCFSDAETGHNERLIARALATWPGDASQVRVATKGGLVRPDGRWEADGRARALTAACEASARALNVSRIALYQLHAVDPRVPLETSVRTLDSLKRRGLIDAVGLCNVTVGQIESARRITDIAAVQVEVNLWHDAAVLGGIVDHCERNGILLLAYRPLGGPGNRRRLEHDPVLAEIAREHDATPAEIALAAIAAPVILPLPGPVRIDTARSAARAARIGLNDDDRARLRERFAVCRATAARESRSSAAAPRRDSEVLLVMGLPAAGKSTLAASLVERGYLRVNRDEAGGSLNALLPVLERAIASGSSRIVLDNTYVSRKSRAAVVQVANRHGLPVRCLWMATSLEDAQVNAVERMVMTYGRLLGPEEMRAAAKQDPAVFPPAVQFRYQRELEPPDAAAEGFSEVEVLPFERRRDPGPVRRAVLVWCDGILQTSRSGSRTPRDPDDIVPAVARGAVLRRYAEQGWTIVGISWLPEIATHQMTSADADAIFDRLRSHLGVAMEIAYCPHDAGPPVCWCRKPLPGLGVILQHRLELNPRECIYVGSGAQDPGFARRLGFQFCTAEAFFGDAGTAGALVD